MTTLMTRIDGYKAVIRPATAEEKQEFFDSTFRNFGVEPDVSQAHVGAFVDEDGNEQSDALPYFLRGMVLNVSADVILPILVEHAQRNIDESNWHAERCDDDTVACTNHEARLLTWEHSIDRRYVSLRGNTHVYGDRMSVLLSKVARRRMRRLIDEECAICENMAPLHCDKHVDPKSR